MSSIKFDKVVSFSSEAKAFPASNLIASDKYKKWQTQKAGENKAFVIIKLEKPAIISGIDIGNEGSAFVEVLASADGTDFVVLLPTSSFMSPMEARNDEERKRVRMFTKLAESASGKVWSYIKVVCSQPFNKTKPFGVTFIRVHGPGKKTDAANEPDNSNGQVGSSKATKAADNDQNDEIGERTRSTRRSLATPKKQSLTSLNRGREVESDDENEGDDEPKPSTSMAEPTRRSTSQQNAQGSPTKSSVSKKTPQMADPTKIMKDVIFALSGFQNPLRSQIRGLALSMGAKYMPDWNDRCTHLVCAFANTPKWEQVARTGGKIVTRDWIDACEKAGKQVAWRDFKCGKYRDKVLDIVDTRTGDDSEAEEEEEEVDDGDSDYAPGKDEEKMDMSQEKRDEDELDDSSLREEGDKDFQQDGDDDGDDNDDDDREKNKKQPASRKRAGDKNNNKFKKKQAQTDSKNDSNSKRQNADVMPTRRTKKEPERQEEPMDDGGDDDSDVPEWDGGDLGSFFLGKKLHIKNDIDDDDERDTLKKYIIGHCGDLTRNAATADIVISWEAEGQSGSASSMRSPLWVVKCHQENRLV